MTIQEWKQQLAYDKAKRRAPYFSGVSKFKAKSAKHSSNVRRNKGKGKLFVTSLDAVPWMK